MVVVGLVLILLCPSSWWDCLGISLSGPLVHDLVSGGFDLFGVCDDVILMNEVINVNVIQLAIEYWSECGSFIGLKILCSGIDGILN